MAMVISILYFLFVYLAEAIARSNTKRACCTTNSWNSAILSFRAVGAELRTICVRRTTISPLSILWAALVRYDNDNTEGWLELEYDTGCYCSDEQTVLFNCLIFFGSFLIRLTLARISWLWRCRLMSVSSSRVAFPLSHAFAWGITISTVILTWSLPALFRRVCFNGINNRCSEYLYFHCSAVLSYTVAQGKEYRLRIYQNVACFDASTATSTGAEFGEASGGCTAEAIAAGRRTFQSLASDTLGEIHTTKGLFSAAFFDLDHDVWVF